MRRSLLVTVRRVTRHRQKVFIVRLITAFCFLTSIVSLMFVTRVRVEWNSVYEWNYGFQTDSAFEWNNATAWFPSKCINGTTFKLTRKQHKESTTDQIIADDCELPMDSKDDHVFNTSLPIINQYQFGFIINCPDVCDIGTDNEDNEILLLIYVHTAVEHFDRRDRIRRTWGNESNYQTLKLANRTIHLRVRTVFILGRSPRRPYLQPALEAEASLFGDIIQKNFHDTYRNLTLKAVAALKWVAIYCQRANYILKADDDVFVNVFALQRYLFQLYTSGRRSQQLHCHVWKKALVVRVGKWSVSTSDIPTKFYPNYCAGLAYIQTGDVTRALYQMSLRVPFFWIDDVYITGKLVAAFKGQVNLADITEFYGSSLVTAQKLVQGRSTWLRLIFAEVADDEIYLRMWSSVMTMGQNINNSTII